VRDKWAGYSAVIPVRLLVFTALLGHPTAQVHSATSPLTPEDEQSLWMADALRDLRKPVNLIDLKSEDHWLSHRLTRVQMLAEVVTFLKVNNPP